MEVKIRPHDLRRHSATYASRNGIPLEVISKIILRHQDLKTTQMYFGRISEAEALRRMDVLGGKWARIRSGPRRVRGKVISGIRQEFRNIETR